MVDFLSVAGLGFLAKGPIAWTPLLTVAVVIIYTRDWQLLRRFKFVGGILLMLSVVALWGIPALIQTHGEFFRLDRATRHRSVVTTMEGHGASSLGHVPAAIAVLFCHGLCQFLSVVDQVAVADRKLMAKKKAGVSDPTTAEQIDTYLFIGHRDHLRHLYSGQHEVTALHAAGVSVACAFARAALVRSRG